MIGAGKLAIFYYTLKGELKTKVVNPYENTDYFVIQNLKIDEPSFICALQYYGDLLVNRAQLKRTDFNSDFSELEMYSIINNGIDFKCIPLEEFRKANKDITATIVVPQLEKIEVSNVASIDTTTPLNVTIV